MFSVWNVPFVNKMEKKENRFSWRTQKARISNKGVFKWRFPRRLWAHYGMGGARELEQCREAEGRVQPTLASRPSLGTPNTIPQVCWTCLWEGHFGIFLGSFLHRELVWHCLTASFLCLCSLEPPFPPREKPPWVYVQRDTQDLRTESRPRPSSFDLRSSMWSD